MRDYIRKRGRRGQANIITVLILVGVTVVMALLLYSYFTNVYVTQSQQQAILNAIALYSTSLQPNVIFTANATPSSGVHLYCVIFTIYNSGYETLTPYISLVPQGAYLANGVVGLSPNIQYVPLNYNTTPPVQTEFAWVLKDIDQDGIVEMLGGTPPNFTIASQSVLGCNQIYYNTSVTSASLTSQALPGSNTIMDPQTGFTLLDDARQAAPTLPSSFSLEAWRLTINPGETVTLYFYIESPVNLTSISLFTFLQFNQYYYYASSFRMLSG